MGEAKDELLAEAMFKLSDRLRASGFLDNDENHRAYEAVVAAFNARTPPSVGIDEGVVERATDIERDIRIAIWNACCWQGKPQEVAQSFIRKAMDEPTMQRALAAIRQLDVRPETEG